MSYLNLSEMSVRSGKSGILSLFTFCWCLKTYYSATETIERSGFCIKCEATIIYVFDNFYKNIVYCFNSTFFFIYLVKPYLN